MDFYFEAIHLRLLRISLNKNRMHTQKLSFLLLTSLLVFTISSCTDNDPVPGSDKLEIPSSYSFENVSYSGQTQRLGMLAEMKSYMGTANTKGNSLEANKLKAMFTNSAGAEFVGTYDSSKQLANKTFMGADILFNSLIDSIASASESAKSGSEGQAGVVESKDAANRYLLSGNGVEYAQLIEKGLMGACFYYQATGVYLSSGKMDVDNEEVTPGKGTTMEHHWDEAFGYFGVPVDFPTNLDGLAFWGSYCNKRNEVLGTNSGLMTAFLKGRASISAKKLDSRDEAIATVREEWEKVVAGTAIHYLNEALNQFDDQALRSHTLSEAAAFIYSLNFNPAKKINNSQIGELLNLIGGSDILNGLNFYSVDKANIETARNNLATYTGLSAQKDQL